MERIVSDAVTNTQSYVNVGENNRKSLPDLNTKLLMTISALVLGAIGVGASFMPEEILTHVGGDGIIPVIGDIGITGVKPNPLLILLVQAFGAVYLGFALLNWSVRGSVIGGIYNKPIALGNLMHFLMIALSLIKVVMSDDLEFPVVMWSITILYTALAVGFYKVTFSRPKINEG